MALADGPPGEIRGGFIFKITPRIWCAVHHSIQSIGHEALVLIMHAVGEANLFVLPTIFRSEA